MKYVRKIYIADEEPSDTVEYLERAIEYIEDTITEISNYFECEDIVNNLRLEQRELQKLLDEADERAVEKALEENRELARIF